MYVKYKLWVHITWATQDIAGYVWMCASSNVGMDKGL